MSVHLSCAARLGVADIEARGGKAVEDARSRVVASGRSLAIYLPDPSEPKADPRWQRLRISITEPGYLWRERQNVRWQEPENECGYLKVVWIPTEELDRSAGTPLDWKFNYQGWLGRTATPADKLNTARAHTHRRGSDPREMTRAEIEAELAEIGARYHDEWVGWRNFVSQPWVEYANVAPDRQRQGLAVAMYQAAAGWLGEEGLALRASTLQRREAEAVWEHMATIWPLSDTEILVGDQPRKAHLFDLRP